MKGGQTHPRDDALICPGGPAAAGCLYADCAATGGAAWLTIVDESKADHAQDRGSEGQAIPTINAESATGEGLSNSERSGKTMMKPVQTHRLASVEGRGGISPLKGDNPPPLNAPGIWR
jgi:hypothetical protein